MKAYDSDLQMFVEAPRALNLNRLTFLRWLAERGRLEHRVAGPSTGHVVGQRSAFDPIPRPAYTGKAA